MVRSLDLPVRAAVTLGDGGFRKSCNVVGQKGHLILQRLNGWGVTRRCSVGHLLRQHVEAAHQLRELRMV